GAGAEPGREVGDRIEAGRGRGNFHCAAGTGDVGNRRMSIRILLADDHSVMRTGLRLVLERQPDFEVIAEASDGREAVGMAQQNRPAVVVMDVTMPNLNGIEAAR